jgi:glycine/D-amino acid oxidase-like deaminating enzyme
MLAPITAELMTRLVMGQTSDFDLAPFASLRFARDLRWK